MTKLWWKDIPNDTLMETAWERQMQLAGIEAFEQSRYTPVNEVESASQTRTGQKTLRTYIDRAAKAIEEMQKKILGVNRVDRNLRGTVLLVPSETAALLSLRVILDATYGTSQVEHGANYQVICKDIAKAIEIELNFRHWVRTSQEAASAYAKVNGLSKTPRSIAERLIAEEGFTRKSLLRWKRTFEELNTYKWDNLEQHYCGEALAKTTIEALPEVFELHNVFKGGRWVKHVRMKDDFRERFDAKEAKIASLQVVRKPMITRPRPWKGEAEC